MDKIIGRKAEVKQVLECFESDKSELVSVCTFSQWIVNRITIENKLDVYAKADTDLTFE